VLEEKPVIKFWGPKGTKAKRPNKSILLHRQKSRIALAKSRWPTSKFGKDMDLFNISSILAS